MRFCFSACSWLGRAVALVLCASLCEGGDFSGAAERAPEVLARLVTKNDGHGGGVLRVSGRQGVMLECAAGRVAGEGSAEMTPSTPFEVASVTKMFTAVAVLQLVEEGKLGLGSTLGELLEPSRRPGLNPKVTIKEMLSHTGGLPDYWTDGSFGPGRANVFLRDFLAEPGRSWRPEELVAYAGQLHPKARGRFHYADTNYVLLGMIVEHLAGRPLHDVFRQRIFRPLGMGSTWMSYHEPRRGAVPSHRYEGAEDLDNVPRQSADWAGGGLVSTAEDLEKFLRGLVGGRLFAKASTFAEMKQFVPVGEPGISYGLGIYRVELDGNRGEVWGHDGHGNSFAYYWPEQGICFAGTLNQTENDWWPLVAMFVNGGGTGLLRGDGKDFDAVLTAGWDSLYMYRGVNSLRGNGRYGNGIGWTALTVSRVVTDRDIFWAEAWNCFATSGEAYREFDLTLAYTRMLGDLALEFGYGLFYGYSSPTFVSHELTVTASQDLRVGTATITPSLSYAYSLGPDSNDEVSSGGSGASFLLARVDANLPVYQDRIFLGPWGALGVNFSYNTRRGTGGSEATFRGVNNLELGLAISLHLTEAVSVAPYVAYSRALTSLVDTAPDTFWGGAQVSFGF